MGLGQTIVRTLVLVSITSQMLASPCTPRSHSKIVNNITIADTKRTKKGAFSNNCVATDTLNHIRFPNVEYPSDSEHEDYYRFLNEYPLQFKSTNDISNCSSQVQKSKMETKSKRKLDMAATAKSKHVDFTSFNKCNPDPQVYCFRTADFFPEVEYPLSSRDMWIPNYWSRLEDVKRENDVETCTNKQTTVTNYDIDYENSALNTLIKALNTQGVHNNTTNHDLKPKTENIKKDSLGTIMNNTETNVQLSQKSPTENNSITEIIINSGINPELGMSEKSTLEDIELISKPDSLSEIVVNNIMEDRNNDVNSCLMTNTTIKCNLKSQQLATKKTAEETCIHIDSINTSASVPYSLDSNISNQTDPIEILDIEGITQSDSAIQTNSSLTESSDIATTSTTASYNMFTPLDYYDTTRLIYLDASDMTTVAPFEHITSSLSVVTDDAQATPPKQYLKSNEAFAAATITTQIPVITTNPPTCLNCSPNLQSNNWDYISPQNVSDDLGDFTKDWVLSFYDSCTTCQFPDYSDDLITYLNAENTSLSLRNISNKILPQDEYISFAVDSSAVMKNSQERPLNMRDAHELSMSNMSNCMTIIPGNRNVDVDNLKGPMYLDYSRILSCDIENTTQSKSVNEYAPISALMESGTDVAYNNIDEILYLDNLNCSLQYECTEDQMTSCTEIPYDFVL